MHTEVGPKIRLWYTVRTLTVPLELLLSPSKRMAMGPPRSVPLTLTRSKRCIGRYIRIGQECSDTCLIHSFLFVEPGDWNSINHHTIPCGKRFPQRNHVFYRRKRPAFAWGFVNLHLRTLAEMQNFKVNFRIVCVHMYVSFEMTVVLSDGCLWNHNGRINILFYFYLTNLRGSWLLMKNSGMSRIWRNG